MVLTVMPIQIKGVRVKLFKLTLTPLFMTPLFIHTDLLGSPAAETDEQGEVL
jgi:hypothetical protein